MEAGRGFCHNQSMFVGQQMTLNVVDCDPDGAATANGYGTHN